MPADYPALEHFLKLHEPFCVSACSQYLHKEAGDSCWILADDSGALSAVFIHSNALLFPILSERAADSLKPFLQWFADNSKIYALHGSHAHVLCVEAALSDLGFTVTESINYDLLELPHLPSLGAPPDGIVLREPVMQDGEELFQLHAGYQKEEVLISRSVFNPAACRLTIEQIVKNEWVLVAELDSRLVGKVHTNALSFSRAQIGGVYVMPHYRRQGIGRYMVASFAQHLRKAGMIPTLFVKKYNSKARSVYNRIGFSAIGSYRISYCAD
jgi:ribosomal protein S18 acetylase RimI-like enzyme